MISPLHIRQDSKGKTNMESLECNVHIRARIDNKADKGGPTNYLLFCIPELFAFFFILFLMCILYVKDISIKLADKKPDVVAIQLN